MRSNGVEQLISRNKVTVVLSLLCLLLSPFAHAHLLKVFAWSDGNAIAGNAYFAGGLPASGADIHLQDQNGQKIATAQPNAKGEFRIVVPAGKQVAKVIADTQEGHIAQWEIAVIEADTKPKPAAQLVIASQSSNSIQIDKTELKNLVSQAVAEQIGPLRMELDKRASKSRLTDILGGIGYIFGLLGLCLWFKSRKQEQV